MRVTLAQYFAASALPACIEAQVANKVGTSDEVVRMAYDYGRRLAVIYEQANTGTNTPKLRSAVE